MKTKKNILVICEGDFEAKIIEKILKYYPLNSSITVYTYKTNIHILGKHLESYYLSKGFSFSEIDIIQVLKEFRDTEILSNKYTDILLIFDFDPQDSRYDSQILLKLQNTFSESTNQGQLFINYPMGESILDFKSLPDPEFLTRKVDSNHLKHHHYKNLVKSYSCLPNLDGINTKSLSIILNHVYRKFESITTIDDQKYIKLLKKECLLLGNTKMVDVLNSCLMFLYDYNPTTFLSFSKLNDPNQ